MQCSYIIYKKLSLLIPKFSIGIMSDEIKRIEVYKKGDFSKWLSNNGKKEHKVNVIIHKKHTGKSDVSAAYLMREAICYGWIDTTAHRLDEDRFMIKYSRRTEKSRWSDNTLRYGKELIAEGKMSPEGMHFYKLGLQKPTHDHGIPKNPRMPSELKKALLNRGAFNAFSKYSKSSKKMLYRWFLRAKQPETKSKRIGIIVDNALRGKIGFAG
jgi:uncharacterized protein YdeI (YjbR/CyaY-like superfamily)